MSEIVTVDVNKNAVKAKWQLEQVAPFHVLVPLGQERHWGEGSAGKTEGSSEGLLHKEWICGRQACGTGQITVARFWFI